MMRTEESIHMSSVYIALVDTPGILASMIRANLKQRYIHVVLSMDAGLKEAYSVGRRYPMIPILAGFEREEKSRILRAFPTARYLVFEIECTPEQKYYIRKSLELAWEERYRYHYAVLGLFFILLKRPFYQKNHYTCSSYIAKLLEENGIRIVPKHFSLVTPRDFLEYQENQGKRILYEGSLEELVDTGEGFSGEKFLRRHRSEAAYGR